MPGGLAGPILALAGLVARPQDSGDATVVALEARVAAWDLADAPGGAAAIARAGELLFARGFGLAVVEHGLENQARTPCEIGQLGELFVLAAAALCEADGKLALTDPVRRFVPELSDVYAPVRVQHLVHRQSGARDFAQLFYLAGRNTEDRVSAAGALLLLARQRALSFEPGSRADESRSNAFLLALVVERVAGEPFDRFVARRLIEPLGLTDTRVQRDPAELVPRLAQGYSACAEAWCSDRSNWETLGTGAVWSSAPDLAKLGSELLRGRVLGADFASRMGERLRLSREPESGAVVWSGAWSGYRAELVLHTHPDLAIALVANHSDAPLLARAVELGRVLGVPPPPSAPAPSAPAPQPTRDSPTEPFPATLAAELTGAFTCEELLGARWDGRTDGEAWVLSIAGQTRAKLRRSGGDLWTLGTIVRANLTRDPAGRIDGFVLEAQGIRGLVFHKQR